jgi:hypothetical protein
MDLRETGWGGMDWIDLTQDNKQKNLRKFKRNMLKDELTNNKEMVQASFT